MPFQNIFWRHGHSRSLTDELLRATDGENPTLFRRDQRSFVSVLLRPRGISSLAHVFTRAAKESAFPLSFDGGLNSRPIPSCGDGGGLIGICITMMETVAAESSLACFRRKPQPKIHATSGIET
jgi:hypothetical protein